MDSEFLRSENRLRAFCAGIGNREVKDDVRIRRLNNQRPRISRIISSVLISPNVPLRHPYAPSCNLREAN